MCEGRNAPTTQTSINSTWIVDFCLLACKVFTCQASNKSTSSVFTINRLLQQTYFLSGVLGWRKDHRTTCGGKHGQFRVRLSKHRGHYCHHHYYLCHHDDETDHHHQQHDHQKDHNQPSSSAGIELKQWRDFERDFLPQKFQAKCCSGTGNTLHARCELHMLYECNVI